MELSKVPSPCCQYESARELPRQCRGREFLPIAEAGAYQAKTYHEWEEARCDIFDYIEVFYNLNRRQGFTNGLSPVDF
ncbi:hypothetical protein DBR44_13725 [Aquitalea sp. FJL05]|nr:hypothetical protein DBR44_13725 [Aquitalea sp. FJL05]